MAVAEDTDILGERVKQILCSDKGQDATLLEWKREEVTKRGDNYLSTLVGASVRYEMEGNTHMTKYVVKQKRTGQGGPVADVDAMVYGKEGGFYTQILPRLNATLLKTGNEALRLPRCPHASWSKDDTHLFLEDLRQRGFTSYDRRKGMDEAHASLVLRELARLHGASLLMQTTNEDLTATYPFIKWQWYNYSDSTKKTFQSVISGGLLTASRLAAKIGDAKVARWYSEVAQKGVAMMEQQLEPISVFDVICHGDCWINNFMFRYDSEGRPVEVMLLDLQFCRRSSLASDLTYFLYTSLTGDTRNNHLDLFLQTYYDAFKSVLLSVGRKVHFTLPELRDEFAKKRLFGILFGTLIMPNLVCEAKEVKEIEMEDEEATQNYVEVRRQNSLSMLESNPLLRPRLVDLYADITKWINENHES